VKKAIAGIIITVVLGGTSYTISQSDIVSNYAKETGQSQEQAQKYVDDVQKNLVSFSKTGD
jgi:hypothetical protein